LSWRDWAVPAALLVVAQCEIWLPGLTKASGPSVAFTVVALGAAVALVLRRTHPLAVQLTVCALMLCPLLLGWFSHSTALAMMLVVALFACGRYGVRPAAYLAVPAASLLVLIEAGPDPDQAPASSWAWSLNTVWVFAVGAALRHERLLRQRASAASEARSRAVAAEERLRLAREVHDVLSHSLSVVVVQAEVADTFLDTDPARSREAIRQVAATGRAALGDTRKIVELLRDTDTGAVNAPPPGLAEIPALVDRLRQSGLPVSLDIGPRLPSLSTDVAATAYRVVQESLTNVLRHAGQAPTRVTLQALDGSMVINIRDHGAAVEPVSRRPGHGLTGMRERVLSCGGELSSGPCAPGGFLVRAVLPATERE
jgi:signal transduction histidine kinase